MTIAIKELHVYPFLYGDGFPLFEVVLSYQGLPYKVLESCTFLGTLTSHKESFRLPDARRFVQTAFARFVEQEAPDKLEGWDGEAIHPNQLEDHYMGRLYEVFEPPALEYYRNLPDEYLRTAAHAADYWHLQGRHYLTKEQLATYQELLKERRKPL